MKTVWIILALSTLALASQAQHHKYDFWEKPYTVQGLLGAVQYGKLKIDDTSGAGDPAEIDISLLPQLGGAWTSLPVGNHFQIGLECSFLIGFRFDEINYISAGGSGLYVDISTDMWIFDLAGGAYANLMLGPNNNVRLYVGGGPLMQLADYDSERVEAEPLGTSTTYNNDLSAFGIGAYARVGIEFRTHDKGMLGIGVRGTWSDVDLSDAGGRSELAGYAAFVSFTAGF